MSKAWTGCKLKSKEFASSEQHLSTGKNPSKDIFLYTQMRQYGNLKKKAQTVVNDYIARAVPSLLVEKEFDLGEINKVFSSHWLNDRQVAFGTKCNKLMVLDSMTGKLLQIPSIKSSDDSYPADSPCGIHSIALNPSGTLFATGAENTNDLAIYQLPTFDPVMVGEKGHTDWIFDISWIDDEFLVTGSRDSRLCLWRVDNTEDIDQTSRLQSLQVPEYAIKGPESVEYCDKANKVRALCYNDYRKELAVLSLNAYFYLWDVETFTARTYRRLFHTKENVCMCVSKERTLYAVGSQSHINLVDPRCPNTLTTIISRYRGGGVRSVSFRDDVLTIGTGVGNILFFDTKAGKYLECGCGHPCTMTVGNGFLSRDENYREFFMDNSYPNAIYTHQFDSTGTRLFAAGGPLPAGLWGNYAGLWH
ncbi:DDB1- and CUL4-associated factor 12-like [Pecten maximus]|uniref:DDB1- and CUL4-associated factor 12-like n=1 Tax=Pecten maximus TaxID=6579 RepID=UPI00145899CC|nr:DDB1- and CUL4-associated factor 12-like [Pecten maximus]